MPAAFDPATHVGPLPSPCIGLCVMTPQTGLCQGCLRTIDEIVTWAGASQAGKRAVWMAIARRRKEAGGNAGNAGTAGTAWTAEGDGADDAGSGDPHADGDRGGDSAEPRQ